MDETGGSEANTSNVQAAARALGLQLQVLNASTEGDFDAVFERLIELRAGGLVIAPDAFWRQRYGREFLHVRTGDKATRTAA